MIRVLVVDDHDLVRTGITRMLADISGLLVVGEAETGEEALKKVRELKPRRRSHGRQDARHRRS